MSDLISRKRIEFELCESNMPKKYRDFCRRVINSESLSPTIDAEPVRHGHWDVVTVGTNFHTDRLCCNCKKIIKSNYWYYCPNCGAKMDEKENSNDE